jgi:hypothetical protein
MSGFYYQVRLIDLSLTTPQLNKIRDYIREKVRSVAAVDSGDFLRSIKTAWDKDSKILTIYSTLYYSGYVEGGTMHYIQHKNKLRDALLEMGLKVGPRRYF